MANNDRIYAAYIGEMGENFKQQTRDRIEWILKQIQDKETVLDIGCSQGIVSILCAEQGAKVTGIEIQKENYDFANQLLRTEYSHLSGKVNFINQDFMEYEEDKKYDAIILTEVLEHLPNAGNFLEHAATFLREEGIVVITVPFSYCDHPDHVYTFYLSSLVKLVEKIFCIESVYFGGKWMACTAGRNGRYCTLDKDLFAQEETAFFLMHKDMDMRLKDLRADLENANRKYKEVCDSYELLKQWRENDQQKLIDVTKAEHQQMLVMRKAKKIIQKQQTEIQMLLAENENYKQSLSIIYDTWYGKIALKCYNYLKIIKRKLIK